MFRSIRQCSAHPPISRMVRAGLRSVIFGPEPFSISGTAWMNTCAPTEHRLDRFEQITAEPQARVYASLPYANHVAGFPKTRSSSETAHEGRGPTNEDSEDSRDLQLRTIDPSWRTWPDRAIAILVDHGERSRASQPRAPPYRPGRTSSKVS